MSEGEEAVVMVTLSALSGLVWTMIGRRKKVIERKSVRGGLDKVTGFSSDVLMR